MADKIGLILLAAGASTRLGRPKQLLLFENKVLLQRVMDSIPRGLFTTHVLVLGAHAEKIKAAIDPSAFVVFEHENWAEGIGSSIREGLKTSLRTEPNLDAVLFLLADQPFVTGELISELVETHHQRKKRITACTYQEIVGVPAILSKDLFPDLLALQGDRGANGLIKKHLEQTAQVSFELGGVDVDTEEDFLMINV